MKVTTPTLYKRTVFMRNLTTTTEQYTMQTTRKVAARKHPSHVADSDATARLPYLERLSRSADEGVHGRAV
ncbi:hypothetical protein D3C72_2031960 [compost metagenome]